MGTPILLSLFGAALAGGADFPNPATDVDAKGKQTAVCAGGCFWCTEAVSEGLAGLENVVSGYAGGNASEAKHDLLGEPQDRSCRGDSDHL